MESVFRLKGIVLKKQPGVDISRIGGNNYTSKIISYKIVSTAALANIDRAKFEQEVMKNIREGWQPHGGVFKEGKHRYFQAMVRYA